MGTNVSDNSFRTQTSRPYWLVRLFDELRAPFRLFTRKYPLRPSSDTKTEPFFIIGSGRCGTTLLRSFLNAHKNLCIPPESYVLPRIIRNFLRTNHRSWNSITSNILDLFETHPELQEWDINFDDVRAKVKKIDKDKRSLFTLVDIVYRQYLRTHAPEAKIWGDKTPYNTLHLEWIYRLFPQSKYIHVIRDGRDVAVSYRRTGQFDSLEEGCRRWLNSLEQVQKVSRKLPTDQILEIRYEEMVDQPERTVQNCCDFMEVEFQSSMMGPSRREQNLKDVENHSHHGKVKEPISDDSVGNWRSLPKEEQNVLNEELSEALERWDYPVSKS